VFPATEMKYTDLMIREISQNLQEAVQRAVEDIFVLPSTSDFLPRDVLEG
jgi:hypothetical protein